MLIVIFLFLLGLKLGHTIAWSWWIIFSPLIAIPALYLFGFVIGLIGILTVHASMKRLIR